MFYGPFSLGGSVTPSGPGYIPGVLGGASPLETQQAESNIRGAYPGVGRFTEFGAQGGPNQPPSTQALGFEFGGAPLFEGQPPSSVDALLANAPQSLESATKAAPETVTASTAGMTAPSGVPIQAVGPAKPQTGEAGSVAGPGLGGPVGSAGPV